MSGKILVVDDNKLNIRLLQEILIEEEYNVFTLFEGSAVLETAKNIKPDAILLDIMMPGIDGFEVCRLLKEDPETEDIPVIMVTAKTEGKDVQTAFDMGAFDYIKKPIDEVEVLARLKSALRYKEQREKLKIMAMKDGLTGLYNHTLLIELFEKEFEKAQRSGRSIAFLMIDIDHFKKVNDNFGHTAGDEVLQSLADLFENNTRHSDILGRYGGEEFGIILPDVSTKDVEQICERIRSAVEEHVFEIDGQSIQITISIGVCFYNHQNKISHQEIIKLADKALYKAKENGRNRVEMIIN